MEGLRLDFVRFAVAEVFLPVDLSPLGPWGLGVWTNVRDELKVVPFKVNEPVTKLLALEKSILNHNRYDPPYRALLR